MKFFKKKQENLIKESLEIAKNEITENASPIFTIIAALGLMAFVFSEKKPNNSPIIVNIYTTKEVVRHE